MKSVDASSWESIDGVASMTIRFSKWRHNDSRIIVRERDAYVGCLRKRDNGWAPSLDLMTALRGAGDFHLRARKDWRSELETVREIQETLDREDDDSLDAGPIANFQLSALDQLPNR